MAFVLAAQAAALSSNSGTGEPERSKTTTRDVYTECFLSKLSALEGTDLANLTRTVSKKKAVKASRQCNAAKTQLATEIEGQLASDPAYSDRKLRALESHNRIAMIEIALLFIYSR